MDKTAQPQNFLASVSDLMSGLLFVFMIVLMGFVHRKSYSDILSTLASAIQEMKALDDKKAADELRALASLR